MAPVDVLVLGAGVAGLSAALAAERSGTSVLVVASAPPARSHSVRALGGMNAVIGGESDASTHARDTLRASDDLADPAAVRLMCDSGAEAVAQLLRDGVAMRRELLGRTAHWSYTLPDVTGATIVEALAARLAESRARHVWGMRACSLVVEDGEVCGAWVSAPGRVQRIDASAVVLATGGYGSLLSPSIAAPEGGSGIALAYGAGAELMDMEFVQFHPTRAAGSSVLVSERARGAGARLLNGLGERFMERYAPEQLELAPRAVVSRAIDEELRGGRGCPGGGVALDFTTVPAGNWQHVEFIRQELIAGLGIDVRSQPVRVEPAVHYTMGGVASDVDGRTSLAGLWACGEAACVSVHGANRLGGNSLLDGIVFGSRAGRSAAAAATGRTVAGGSGTPPQATYRESARLRALLGASAGIRRNGDSLRMALGELRRDQQPDPGPAGELAAVVLACALAREESRGAHHRSDFPERRGSWRAHTVARRSDDRLHPVLTRRMIEAAVEPADQLTTTRR